MVAAAPGQAEDQALDQEGTWPGTGGHRRKDRVGGLQQLPNEEGTGRPPLCKSVMALPRAALPSERWG